MARRKAGRSPPGSGVLNKIQGRKQTTKRGVEAAACVSFYDAGSHEPTPPAVRTEVRAAAGRGGVFSAALPRGGHRPHAPDRSARCRRFLARHRFAVRLPAALPPELLAGPG